MSGSNVETWRVVLTDGGVHEVPVERLAEVFGVESYLARFRHAAAWGETPRLAVLRLASRCFGEAVEIVSPDGNITSDVHALRNERGVLLREVLRLRAENDMLRKSTDAALKVAREEGEAAAREWAANVCERMVIGGCAWSEEQASAGRALLDAAGNIRTLPMEPTR